VERELEGEAVPGWGGAPVFQPAGAEAVRGLRNQEKAEKPRLGAEGLDAGVVAIRDLPF